MGLFKKKKENMTKEEWLRKVVEKESQKPPSKLFVSGAVFDISKKTREAFIEAVSTNDSGSLLKFFDYSYSVFLKNPACAGIPINWINASYNDTDPATWNADCFQLSGGDYAALLFMPIQDKSLSARIVGIIFSDKGDGYYYSMLNSDENKPSDVNRNMEFQGIHKVGEVKGSGFELMNSFLECIKTDYYTHANNQSLQTNNETETSDKNVTIPNQPDSDKILYLVEHEDLPGLFYFNPILFLEELSKENGFQKMIQKFSMVKGLYSLPYPQDDFKVDVGKIDENTLMALMFFPNPSRASLCYRIYAFTDLKFQKPSIYMIEKGKEGGYLIRQNPKGECEIISPIASLNWNDKEKALMQTIEVTLVLDEYHKESR